MNRVGMWVPSWDRSYCCWVAVIVLLFLSTPHVLANGSFNEKSLRRRIVHFGNMDSINIKTAAAVVRCDISSDLAMISARKKRVVANEEEDLPLRSKLWPPWPFNLIGKKSQAKASDDGYPSTGTLFWEYLRHRSRVGIRQLQQLGSELWFHLPPATPPFVLLAAIPLRVKGSDRRIPTLFTNPFVRNLALASLGFAVLSWGHAELDRKRLLEPLPITEHLQDVARAILPPFLPEEVEHDWNLDVSLETEPIVEEPIEQLTNIEDDDEEAKKLQKKLRRHLLYLYRSPPKPQSLPSTVKQWRLRRHARKALSDRAKRLELYDQLVALQALKKRAVSRKKQNGKNRSKVEESINPLGYALITGASRGIGRALAVELARWEIPLILVARDEERLVRLATDLERCYGVKCCVLPVDLSKPGAAEKVYKATTAAGLQVDVLVNNAGLSSSGEFVDMEEQNLQHILQVNAMAVASLSHSYGSDMKKRRRGRILIVSSIVGVSYAGPTVAAYAATKAFEKVLGLSMAKELEVYGVGVTCLMPGAVGDSSFRGSSGSTDAICWKIPFYVKSCESVADQGVRALLLGDLEVIPGWQNRAFAKILLPILPQRGITLITETAWNPLSNLKPNLRRNARRRPPTQAVVVEDVKDTMPRFTWPGNVQKMPPAIIKIPDSPIKAPSDRDDNKDQSLIDSSGEQVFTPPARPETTIWILGATDPEVADDIAAEPSQIPNHDEGIATSSDVHPSIERESVDVIPNSTLKSDPQPVEL